MCDIYFDLCILHRLYAENLGCFPDPFKMCFRWKVLKLKMYECIFVPIIMQFEFAVFMVILKRYKKRQIIYSQSLIKLQGESILDTTELWLLMLKKKKGFLYFYKAYHHLRQRNWIVRTGHQYGTDFIAYRHHPSQVHAEYVMIDKQKMG